MNKFKIKSKIKSIFGKGKNGKKVLVSTSNPIVCYRCQVGGGTLVKDAVGYRHQHLLACVDAEKIAQRLLKLE